MNAAVDATDDAIDTPMVDRLVGSLLSDVDMALLPNAPPFCDEEASYDGIEPSSEPCTDDIPYEELVYWFGTPTECSCSTCDGERLAQSLSNPLQPTESVVHGHFVFIPSSRSRGLSTKIPVIAMPRIEGVN